MKHQSYFIAASFGLLLSACDLEQNATNNTDKNTTTVLTDIAPVKASPYNALRPTDNRWPVWLDDEEISDNLLTSNYYVVLDGSGSMAADNCAEGSTKMTIAKQAISQFSQQIPTDANLALLAFDAKGASERVPLSGNNRVQFNEQVNTIQSGGGTPLKSAITFAYQKLKKQAVKQLGYGEYHLVVVTDGIAKYNEKPDRIVQVILEDSPVVIHSIGFCLNEKHSLNQPGMTNYTAASNAEELKSGLQAVLAESPDFISDHF